MNILRVIRVFLFLCITVELCASFTKQPARKRQISASTWRERCVDCSGKWLEAHGNVQKSAGAIQCDSVCMTRGYVDSDKTSILLKTNDKQKLQQLHISLEKITEHATAYEQVLKEHDALVKQL